MALRPARARLKGNRLTVTTEFSEAAKIVVTGSLHGHGVNQPVRGLRGRGHAKADATSTLRLRLSRAQVQQLDTARRQGLSLVLKVRAKDPAGNAAPVEKVKVRMR